MDSSAPTITITPSGRLDLPVSHGRLEALLKEPASRTPRRAAVVCHPHPKGGGTMNNNVVYRMAKALEESGAAVLRFNFRGVGRSTGEYGEGVSEAEDARTAVDFMAARYPTLPLWMAGFSFGARVGMGVGIEDPRVSKLLGVGLAVRMFDLGYLHRPRGGKPFAIIQATNDEYGDQRDIEPFVEQIPEPRRLWLVDDATHLFPGRLDPLEATLNQAISWLETFPEPTAAP
ncbi:MAG: alpha/beta family hydrolase [Myxococcales bacterium]